MGTNFISILKSFSPFSTDNTTDHEIEYLHLLPFELAAEEIDTSKKLILILVESRILETIPNSTYSSTEVLKRLYNFKTDLQRDGFEARFIEAKVYAGPLHKDGKTLLALRNFFKTIKNTYGNFEGVILVGSFPEAMIVRTWLRPETSGFTVPSENASFPDGTLAYHVGNGVHAYRSEIVLANLSGNWESIYHLSKTVPSGIFKPDTETKLSSQWTRVSSKKGHYRLDSMNYEDFFWIKDDQWQIESQGQDTIALTINSNQLDSTRAAFNQLNPEISDSDKLSPNPIAQPDILVSRINAKNVAVNPDLRLLDDYGKPKRVPYNPDISTDIFNWEHNPDLEIRLLVEYFDRNHAFRTGRFSSEKVTLSKIEYESGLDAVNEGLAGITVPTDEIHNASLLDFVHWLKRSITIRGISAHTAGRSACMTVFRNNNQHYQIETQTGGTPWRWVHQNGEYIPSFQGQYTADINLYRTIWENKILQNTVPSFFLHVGSDTNTPDRADTIPYNAQGYGACQSAESVLFYLNGLSVISQAKMCNDGPMGFGFGFGSSDDARLGDGWKEYFRYESQNTKIAKNSTDRKRCFCWSIMGDWTLKKFYTPMIQHDNRQAQSSSGFLKKGNLGKTRGNFELIAPGAASGFEHLSRDNDDPKLTWYGPTCIDSDKVDSCSLIQSNFGDFGNLEVVVRSGNHLHYHWREDSWPFQWHSENISLFSKYKFCGNPAFIQGSLGGNRGNFELVVPLQSGGLAHFSRNNHTTGIPWETPVFFGDQKVEISGVAMIQSSLGGQGNLEVVAVEKNRGRLVYYWCDGNQPYQWNGPVYFGGPGFSGVPSLIQSDFGNLPGNFELVVPVKGGGLAHYFKSNIQQENPWNGPVYFGSAEVNAVSMVQTNFGQLGHLEIVAIENGKLMSYWRDDTSPYNWHGPDPIRPVSNNPPKKKSQKLQTSVVKEPALVEV
jgi:hypothetical protein